MKTILLSLFTAFLLTTNADAQVKAVQKAVIQTPNLQCQACKDRVERRLFKEPGISVIKADFHKHTVAVTFVSERTNIENIKTSLANLGYDADDITADDAYKTLPKTCQHIIEKPASVK
ncbi:MAG: heavy-metal-associated domain-containing protein [Ginsengibacter sp.]